MNPSTAPLHADSRQRQAATEANAFTVGDAGHVVGRSPSTIRRIIAELRLDVRRTPTGLRVLTLDQVQKIASEFSRRQREEFQP
jgi:hypothetical protein